MSRFPLFPALQVEQRPAAVPAKENAMVFSEYLASAKGAVAQVKSQVRYHGANRSVGWIRHPFDVSEKFLARVKWGQTRLFFDNNSIV